MPIITIDGDRNWAIPLLHGGILDSDGPYTPQHRLTFMMGSKLRSEMPNIYRSMGKVLSVQSVVVNFVPPHDAINQADVWVIVSPTIKDLESISPDVLLDAVRDVIRDFLANLQREVLKPAVDIDISYSVGAGLTLSTTREEVARW